MAARGTRLVAMVRAAVAVAMMVLCLCTSGAAAALVKAADLPTTATADGRPVLLQNYHLLVPNGIRGFNPFLTDAQAVNSASLAGSDCQGRPKFATCADTPAFASGMAALSPTADGTLQFLGLTDRGPNQDCRALSKATNRSKDIGAGNPAPTTDSGKGFPVKEFSPTISRATLDSAGCATVTQSCHLKRTDGTPVTGVSTREADDLPMDAWCQNRIDYDEGGQDTEDLQPIPGTPYGLMVEEYSPAVSVVNIDMDSADCGKILVRYVPSTVRLDRAGYPVSSTLPASFDQRRKNRGMEGVAVSPDGKSALAIFQSAMDVRDQKYFDAENHGYSFSTKDTQFVPVALMDISDPLQATVTGTFYYPIDLPATWGRAPGKEDKVKLSAGWWASSMLGLADSRRVAVILERDTSVRLYLVDFDAATLTQEASLTAAAATLLNTTANLAKRGVRPAPKRLIVDTKDVAAWQSEGNSNKAEGMVFPNEAVAVLASDNDFGHKQKGPTRITTIRLGKTLTEVYSELQDELFHV